MNKLVAQNVVDRLIDLGTKLPGTREQMVEEVYEMIHDDHIPGGRTAKEATNFRTAPAGRRCGMQVGDDIQSGPYYCGQPASLIADCNGNSTVSVCTGHENALRGIKKK